MQITAILCDEASVGANKLFNVKNGGWSSTRADRLPATMSVGTVLVAFHVEPGDDENAQVNLLVSLYEEETGDMLHGFAGFVLLAHKKGTRETISIVVPLTGFPILHPGMHRLNVKAGDRAQTDLFFEVLVGV